MTAKTDLLLEPCPFCGGPAARIDFGPEDAENEGGSCIACTRCQSSGPVEFGRKENFASNWNRRAHATEPLRAQRDELAAEIEALRAEVDRLRDALEEIRNRSSIAVMRSDQSDQPELEVVLGDICLFVDAALSKENSND